MKSARVLFVTIALCFVGVSSSYAQTPFTRDHLISESCRLTEEQRYADAVVMAERLHLVSPGDPGSLVTDGAVALQVGALANASAYVNAALEYAPTDPLALYEKALLALLENNPFLALKLINSINQTALSDEAINDIGIARSICLAETGHDIEAAAGLAATQDPAGKEALALITFRQNPADTDILKNCLQSAMINGVPEVVEEPGLRLLLPANASGPAIEPSISDPAMQQDLGSRFDSSAVSGGLRAVTGVQILYPPRAAPTGTNVVTFSVDGGAVGVNNYEPYQFKWDSRSVQNGPHTLTFTMTGNVGNQIGIQEVDCYVINTDQTTVGNFGPLTEDQTDRLWRLLRVRPDYKVAEYELAIASSNEHDQEGYETHILRAAALDPDYRDVRSRIHPLFAGEVPKEFPVPDGTTLPSSLGLSAGSASKAGFWAGSPKIREMALTFDDGPLPEPTKELLDALRSVDALGTFFIVGMRGAQSPDSLRQMAADGHAVEDHTFTHPNLTQILPQHILLEILRTAVVIQATTGLWPHFLRPPGGNTNASVLETARICGMSGAFWTIDALPAEEAGSPEGVAKWVISRARPGAIVLMHNGMAATVAAIPELVKGLRDRGYKLVTIRQLAADAVAGQHAGT